MVMFVVVWSVPDGPTWRKDFSGFESALHFFLRKRATYPVRYVTLYSMPGDSLGFLDGFVSSPSAGEDKFE